MVHEFVALNLFFTAKQTVSFVSLGPNAVSITGMIERAIAQEEDEAAQLSNDFISSRLGFGGELSPEQEAMAMMMFGGGEEEEEEDVYNEELLEEALEFDDVGEEQPAGEETKKKKKKKKKKTKKQKTEDDNDEDGPSLVRTNARQIERDPMLCVAESIRRK